MPYALAPGVHCCLTGRQAVFLDVAEDAYFCVPPADADVVENLARGQDPLLSEIDAVASLINQGLVVESNAPAFKFTCCETPSASLHDAWLMPQNLLAVLYAGFLQLDAAERLRRKGLHHTIVRLAQSRCASPIICTLDDTELVATIKSFYFARRLVRATDQCLPTSLALTAHLRRMCYDANLVIGVKTAPFAAHAWVQSRTVVLNDFVENVAQYSPVLVS